MTQTTRRELAPGVYLTAVRTRKFKSSVLSASLLVPLKEETAAAQALVPYVLRRGSRAYPDMGALAARLDELYGGSLEPVVRKKGESQCLGFVGSFLDDAYAPDGEPILERAAELLEEVLLRPCREGEGFVPAYVEGERANLIARIRAQINDKRQYAMQRLVEEMCRGEAYGVDRLGDEAGAAAVTAESLWQTYRSLLATARVELYYCGSASPERVCAALAGLAAALPAGAGRQMPSCQVKPGPDGDRPRVVEEVLEVSQGKLALGFRTGGVSVRSEEYPALLVFNAVYGGTTTSKLFLNVRERLSLCYFASSQLEKSKGVLLVSSGIEFDKYDQAKAEILSQLDSCRRGEIEDWELTGAVRSIVGALKTTLDSQGRLEEFWLGQNAAGEREDPEELARRVEAVTREQVAAVAQRVCLDSVYFLKGKEAAG